MGDQEERRQALSVELLKLESLTRHDGWTLLMQIANSQIDVRFPKTQMALKNLLELGIQEFEKGEIAGIKLFQLLPGQRIADLKGEIERFDEEMEDARTTEQPVASGAGGSKQDAGDEFDRPSP